MQCSEENKGVTDSFSPNQHWEGERLGGASALSRADEVAKSKYCGADIQLRLDSGCKGEASNTSIQQCVIHPTLRSQRTSPTWKQEERRHKPCCSSVDTLPPTQWPSPIRIHFKLAPLLPCSGEVPYVGSPSAQDFYNMSLAFCSGDIKRRLPTRPQVAGR